VQSNCAIVTKKLIDVMGLIDGPGHPFSNSFAQFSMVISRVNSCTFSNLLRKIYIIHTAESVVTVTKPILLKNFKKISNHVFAARVHTIVQRNIRRQTGKHTRRIADPQQRR
jgi:hypothetical protein